MEPDQIVATAEKAARKINAPIHLWEELRSEAIVGAVEATKTWDASKGIPEGAWLYQNARWAALDFIRKEARHKDVGELTPMNEPSIGYDYMDDWRDFISAIQRLDAVTTQVLLSYACGVPIAMMSKRFKATGSNLKAIMEQGRAQASIRMIS